MVILLAKGERSRRVVGDVTPPETSSNLAYYEGAFWVIQQVANASWTKTWVNSALERNYVKGFGIRYNWPVRTAAIRDGGKALADAAGKNFSERVIAGHFTPDAVKTAIGGPDGPWMYRATQGTQAISCPIPWNKTTGEPGLHPALEEALRTLAQDMCNYARAEGIRVVHGNWFGKYWAELNHETQLQAVPGYTFSAWLEGHRAWARCFLDYAEDDIMIEFALSGHPGGRASFGTDIANMLLQECGGVNYPDKVVVQGNGWGDPNLTGPTSSRPINWAKQMYNQVDPDGNEIDWSFFAPRLNVIGAKYLEVYAESWNTSSRPAGGITVNGSVAQLDHYGQLFMEGYPGYSAGNQPPSAPTSLLESNVTQTTINLAWSPSTVPSGAEDVVEYRIYNGSTLLQTVTAVTGSTQTTQLTGLSAGTVYTLTVKAYNGLESAASNTRTVTTTAAATAPNAPSNLQQGTVGETTANLTWTSSTLPAGAAAVTEYRVYSGSTLVKTVTPVAGTSQSTQLTGLTPSTNYTITVRAYNGLQSAASNSVSVTTQGTVISDPLPSPATVTSTTNGERLLTTTSGETVYVRYPLNSSGQMLSDRPLILIGHGLGMGSDMPAVMQGGTFLNRAGYVTASSNMDAQSTYTNKARLMTRVLNAVLADSTLAPGILPNRIGYYGGSNGAITSVTMQDPTVRDARYRCFVARSPWHREGEPSWADAPPYLVMLGTADPTVLPARSREVYNAATSPKGKIELEGAAHNMVLSGSNIVQDASKAFFSYYLCGVSTGLSTIQTLCNADARLDYVFDWTPDSVTPSQAPNAPTSLAAGTITQTTINLTWTASTLPSGASAVTEYRVYSGTSLIKTVTPSGGSGQSTQVTGLTADTSYTLSVRAFNGELSAVSNSITVETLPTVVTPSGNELFLAVSGVWALQEDYGASYLSNFRTAIAKAPSLHGFGWRYYVNTACNSAGDLDTSTTGRIPLFINWAQTVNTENPSKFFRVSLRPLLGKSTPTAWLNDMDTLAPGALTYTYNSLKCPHPCYNAPVTHSHDGLGTHSHAVGEPNDIFAIRFRRHIQQLVSYLDGRGLLGQDNLVPFIHGGYHGYQYSEYYYGPPVQQQGLGALPQGLANYTPANHRAATLGIVDIMYDELPADVATEFATTGAGPMVGDYTSGSFVPGVNPFVEALVAKLISKYGSGSQRVYLSYNGWHDLQVAGGDSASSEYNKQYASREASALGTSGILAEFQDILRSTTDNFAWTGTNGAFRWIYGGPNDVLAPWTGAQPNRRSFGVPGRELIDGGGPVEVYLTRFLGSTGAATNSAQLEAECSGWRAEAIARAT